MLVSAIPLTDQPLYQVLLFAQLFFYALAILGNLFQRRLGKVALFYIPAYFCATNLGALLALWNFVTGRRYQTWQPVNRP